MSKFKEVYGILSDTDKRKQYDMFGTYDDSLPQNMPNFNDIFENIAIKTYKGFEHGKVKPGDIDGTKLAKMSKDALDYVKRLKELRVQLEQRVRENSIEEIYKNLFEMLGTLLKKKDEAGIIRAFESEFVKTGKYPKRHLTDLKFIAKVRKEVMDKKQTNKEKKALTPTEVYKLRLDVETARRFGSEITNLLIEHNQRCEFLSMDRKRESAGLRVSFKSA